VTHSSIYALGHKHGKSVRCSTYTHRAPDTSLTLSVLQTPQWYVLRHTVPNAGSHFDAVPGGGKYDGVAGIVLSLAAIEATIAEAGIKAGLITDEALRARLLAKKSLKGTFPSGTDFNQLLNKSIELIAFAEEEGVRYAPTCSVVQIQPHSFTQRCIGHVSRHASHPVPPGTCVSIIWMFLSAIRWLGTTSTHNLVQVSRGEVSALSPGWQSLDPRVQRSKLVHCLILEWGDGFLKMKKELKKVLLLKSHESMA
jgi:hypothetical protein